MVSYSFLFVVVVVREWGILGAIVLAIGSVPTSFYSILHLSHVHFRTSLILHSALGMPRSNEDKVEIIFFYGEAHRNLRDTVRLFNAANPETVVSFSYVQSLVAKFATTFSFKNAPRSGRPTVRTEELQVHVLGEFARNPKQSVRTVARECGTSLSTVQRILKVSIYAA
jgi:hypothetical protein